MLKVTTRSQIMCDYKMSKQRRHSCVAASAAWRISSAWVERVMTLNVRTTTSTSPRRTADVTSKRTDKTRHRRSQFSCKRTTVNFTPWHRLHGDVPNGDGDGDGVDALRAVVLKRARHRRASRLLSADHRHDLTAEQLGKQTSAGGRQRWDRTSGATATDYSSSGMLPRR
jgi:hypothetical protein